MSCICNSIPLKRSGQIQTAKGVVLGVFHLDCPEHGIVTGPSRPMKQVWKQGWLTPIQIQGVLSRTPARLIEKAKDLKSALIEWLEWEFYPEGEAPGELEDVIEVAA